MGEAPLGEEAVVAQVLKRLSTVYGSSAGDCHSEDCHLLFSGEDEASEMDGKPCLSRVGLTLSHMCVSENQLKTYVCSAGMMVKAELVRSGTRTCGVMES